MPSETPLITADEVILAAAAEPPPYGTTYAVGATILFFL